MNIVVLWELLSADATPARCTHQHEPDAEHFIIVTVGEKQLIREEVDSEAAAVDEAGHLLADFTLRGWSTVIYRDPRID